MAQNNFESLIFPFTSAEFFEKYYEKEALLVRGEKSKFEGLFSRMQLDSILTRAKSPHPTLRLVEDERRHEVASSKDILENLREGRTLILEEVDRHDEIVMRFANTISKEFGEDCRINLYLSPPGHQGFRTHYDTQDVFALQVGGTKRWRVYRPTIENPLFFMKRHGNTLPPDETLYKECVMNVGDVLYIPRGHWHDAFATSEESLHLTLSVFVRTKIDFMAWLVNELRADLFFRQSLPIAFGSRNTSVDVCHPHMESLSEMADRVAAKIRDLNTVRAFDIDRVHNQRDRFTYDLRNQTSTLPWSESQLLSFVSNVRPFNLTRDKEHLFMATFGATIKIPIKMEAAVVALNALQEPVSGKNLKASFAGLSAEEFNDLLWAFVNTGVVSVVREK